jgi:hypothetical protein
VLCRANASVSFCSFYLVYKEDIHSSFCERFCPLHGIFDCLIFLFHQAINSQKHFTSLIDTGSNNTVFVEGHFYKMNNKMFKILLIFSCVVWNALVSVLALSTIDHWTEPLFCQTKDCKMDIYCFSAKHTTLRCKSKD